MFILIATVNYGLRIRDGLYLKLINLYTHRVRIMGVYEMSKDLCQWLRDNSSGAYRKSAEAADRIEELEAEVRALRPIYHHARGLMRHNGVDKDRADLAYANLQGFTHEATAFYDEQD